MWREKNIYFTEPDIYFTILMFILKNINLELKSALRTKYIFYQSLLYWAIFGMVTNKQTSKQPVDPSASLFLTRPGSLLQQNLEADLSA